MKFEFSAGGLVYKKQHGKIEFAMVLNHDQKWTFPKGHIEKNEKPEVAAKREVSEEIGIETLDIVDLLEKIDYWFVSKKEKIHKFVYFYLMAAPANAELIPQLDEVGDARWFSFSEINNILHYKEDLQLFQIAQEKLDQKS